MIDSVTIKRFRSIEEQQVRLRPLTVIYGPASSGKSSLLYALLVLKNFVCNPKRQIDEFFSFGYLDLGGFDNCVYNHEAESEIEIAVTLGDTDYGIQLRKRESTIPQKEEATIWQKIDNVLDMHITVTLPHDCREIQEENSDVFSVRDGSGISVLWNGIMAFVAEPEGGAQDKSSIDKWYERANAAVGLINGIDVIPYRRGFTKPAVKVRNIIAAEQLACVYFSEEDVVSLIASFPEVKTGIAREIQYITGKQLDMSPTYLEQPDAPLITETLSLRVWEPLRFRNPFLLVNEGAGVNQLIYMFAKIYAPWASTLLIEEPEVYLHPSLVRKLARSLCRIVTEEGKQLVMITHSEVLVTSLLACVSRKEIDAQMVGCYLAEKQDKSTIFHYREVYENGQIEGGLSPFMEGYLDDLKSLMGL